MINLTSHSTLVVGHSVKLAHCHWAITWKGTIVKKETWSIGFACLLGAFIGTLVALEISECFTYGSWLWGIGALVGGFVAYCAVDFRHFCAGVVRSYQKTINWRPDRPYWKAYGIYFGGSYTLCISLVGFTEVVLKPTDSIIILLIMFAIISAVLTWAMLSNWSNYDDERRLHYARQVTDLGWRLMRNYNPIGIAYWVCWGALWAIRRIPSVGTLLVVFAKFHWMQIRQFTIEIFFYVHSGRRKICFVDAALGATAGYFFGSAIFGAVIGAILGIVNYEIVSIRWLKILPTKMPK